MAAEITALTGAIRIKFGLLADAADFVHDFVQNLFDFDLDSTAVLPHQFYFPGVKVKVSDEVTYTIVEDQFVPLDNGIIDVLRPSLSLLVMIISIISILNMLRRYWLIIIGDEVSKEIHHWDD